jgi:hypothetical protein
MLANVNATVNQLFDIVDHDASTPMPSNFDVSLHCLNDHGNRWEDIAIFGP